MLSRVARASRQGLPRPARLYSTPSKAAKAAAALATTQVPRPDFPPFLSQQQDQHRPEHTTKDASSSVFFNDLESFLKRSVSYTILPTPLPADRTSQEHERWYSDSATQDLTAVMDACLHNLYDVPRAKLIFEQLRGQDGNVALQTPVYNAFLEAYVNMATQKDPKDRSYWISNTWELYDILERGSEKVGPDETTYAIMLVAWNRFRPSRPAVRDSDEAPVELLDSIVHRQISITRIISDRFLNSDEEAAAIISLLSKAAVLRNLPAVVNELGHAEALGTTHPDILKDIPEIKPVLRPKKKSKTAAAGEEAENKSEEPEMEIPFNLETLRRHLADVALARRVLPDDVAARQKFLEESVYDAAVARLEHQAELFADLKLDNTALMQHDLQRWMWEWHLKLKARLEEEIKAIVEAEASPRIKTAQLLSPYLKLVNADRLSMITILEIMRLQGAGGIADGMKTTRALVAVGKAVEVEYKAQMCRSNKIPIPTSSRLTDSNLFSTLGYRNLQQRRVAAARHMSDGESWTAPWSQAVRSKVGGILVECLMDVAEVTRTAVDSHGDIVYESQPAFYHSYEYVRGQKLGVIRLNTVVGERLAKDKITETLHPRHLPMLVKPKPWLSYDQGGYLYSKNYAMRFKDSLEQQIYLKQASDLGNVELVYAGLDVLGSTPWRINKKVFDVVLSIWNAGERMGKIPPAVFDLPEPTPPENYDPGDLKARSIFLQRQRAHTLAKANNHSDRCNVNYKIEVARAFLGDALYLPHNLDFRGRAYPIPPHLNHIGDDICRGLLMFDDGKPLGERGLRWLKVHLANLYGFDKANFDERVAWVMDHMDDIYDSATKPLEGRRWWSTAGDPWQCLATCFELHAALESPDPHAYISRLPVHQDGTCNGLQHYAALGGDARGAQQVNLAAADRPSDVYSHVGNMVEKMLEEAVKRGDKYAIMLQGKITRKVVKQTVMTTVYGVTFVGAREQLERQLKDRKDIPEEECWGAASYLAKMVLACIGDLFSGARSIQNWLNLCARLISKSIPEERLPEAFAQELSKSKTSKGKKNLPKRRLKKEQMTSVIWTTPLGLPIVQPYRKSARKQVMTSVQSVYISDPNSPAEVNSIKQASAFPPNFIHSLDATHMMLTALECQRQGLTFASVHDSYWTHASCIDKMSETIRDTFIALHSSDVLGKLRDEFLTRYKGYKIPLVNLRTGSIIKGLRDAGSKIIATPEQAKSLKAISELVEISETEKPTVAEENVSKSDEELKALLNELEAPEATTDAASVVDADLEEEFDDEEEYLSSQGKAAKLKKIQDDKAAIELLGKFVDLGDILPPLPEKGTFKVETIKSSQYFFS